MTTVKGSTESVVLGGMLTEPALACAGVIQQYGAPAFKHWREITATNAADALELTIAEVQSGDLSAMEAMLVSQAVALQAVFTTLAQRAAVQTVRENITATLGLALKAQAQSRATIQAIADIKFPRTTAFVKQTNIAHGAQQVNNGVEPPREPVLAREENSTMPNKLIAQEVAHGGTILDAGATRPAGRSHHELEPMAVINGAKKRGGKVCVRA
jgi:hypothetical protein